MTFVPSVIAVDYETALTSGAPSTEYYRGDFRAISCAFAWRGQNGELRSLYLEGEEEIGAFLERIRGIGSRVAVHNFQFEYGVSLYRFPGFEECITHDTMRLAQVADNGGKLAAYQPQVLTYDDMLDALEGNAPKPQTTGLSLVSAASRWLPEEWRDHKAPYHAWLRENAGVKKGHEGQHLTKLPAEMLEAYNVADAKVTLLLYETFTKEFERIGYDYRLDHDLYKSTARMVAKAKGTGAAVDTAVLEAYVAQVETEIAAIEQRFRGRFSAEITKIEASAHRTYVDGVKTEKAKARRQAEEPARFNVGSNKQLKLLFVDTLGIEPKFWTKEPKAKPGKPRKNPFVPSPSFKSAHLSTYGEGGELLRTRRKRMLVLQQARALLKLASYDGRWHFDLRACGTATGRMAGGRA
jgi:hypothetical protein